MQNNIDSLITTGTEIIDLFTSNPKLATNKFLEWNNQVKLATEILPIYPRICSALMVPSSVFFKEPEVTSSISSITQVLALLKSIPVSESVTNELNEQSALTVVRLILRNFHKHIEEMYQKDVHGRSTLNKADLDKIVLHNEYDVQRMLFSLLKPIFPNARLEVYEDGGYVGTRYDIFISEYNLVIEVKCTRSSMSERTLTEEVGSDICHYQHKHIMFFIFDKQKIITNPDAFETNYSKDFDEKHIKTYIVQPISI